MKTDNKQFIKKHPIAGINEFDGVLIVDKPAGPTSHDIVAQVRRKFKFVKVGHGGTLDPQATGVLVLLIGKGTKLSSSFMGADKVYKGVIRLGISTDSQDAQGKILQEADAGFITRERLELEMKKLTGDIFQVPPMVSAVKVKGKPLYKYARKGKIVERKPRLIHIYEFKLIEFVNPRATFILRCTKGTYVRTLCSDIGDTLKCGAHLEELRRVQSGNIKIDDALPMDEIASMSQSELLKRLIPLYKFPLYTTS